MPAEPSAGEELPADALMSGYLELNDQYGCVAIVQQAALLTALLLKDSGHDKSFLRPRAGSTPCTLCCRNNWTAMVRVPSALVQQNLSQIQPRQCYMSARLEIVAEESEEVAVAHAHSLEFSETPIQVQSCLRPDLQPVTPCSLLLVIEQAAQHACSTSSDNDI